MVKRRIRFAIWWRRAGMGLRSLVLLLAVSAFALLVYWQQPEAEASRSGSHFLLLVLVNLNVVILCVLAFLIGRNIVKLVFDRRRKILGSKLRLRLVVAFVGVTLIPIIILFVLASGLLTRAMQGWFSTTVESSVNGAVEVARQHYTWLREYVRRVAQDVASDLPAGQLSDAKKQSTEDFLEMRRKKWGLFSIALVDAQARVMVGAYSAMAGIDSFKEPAPEAQAVERALKNETGVSFEESESSQFVRAYLPINGGQARRVLVTTLRISPELAQALAAVNDSLRDYEQLKFFKRPLRSGYLLTLALITGLLLFSAIWFAFYMAREMAVPIQRLAEATQSVAKGRYDIQIREKGDDEMAFLVRSFNQMTAEIRNSRAESERRRIYIETILANLAVGVIGIDREHRVQSVNAAAARDFSLDHIAAVRGHPIAQCLRAEDYQQIQPLLEAPEEGPEEGRVSPAVMEKQIEVVSQGRQLKILCTVGQVKDDLGNLSGYVLLFDDITDLSRAQHMSAWREVAQRIAHEFKNPLTPIRLSAQRLSKLVNEAVPADGATGKIVDCTQTIVENVDSIARLADEFSNFARMPRAEFRPSNLNSLVSDTIQPFAESHAEISFQFIADNHMPEIQVDPEQIRRVLINLLDNGISALKSSPPGQQREAPRIVLRSHYDRRRKMASLEVADNGPGIKSADKTRIFEPYFTTKKGGTGLGLAIVTSIVADHQGEVRVYDNQPCGAKFIVDLPLNPVHLTQRRFATS